MNKVWDCAGLAFLLLTAATPAGGSETPLPAGAFCVAPNGDDRSPGTPERPWRSIQHAATQLAPGRTVCVRAGVYEEAVTIRAGGTAAAGISLENFPGERPVIDGQFRRQFGICVRSAGYVRIKGFEVRNCKGLANPAEPENVGGILLLGTGARPVTHCSVSENVVQHIIGLSPASDAEQGKEAAGIGVNHADGVCVENNTVYDVVGQEAKGIKCGSAGNMLIRRNLCCLCDKEGIRLLTQDTDSENVIEENIALHNHIGITVNSSWTSRKIVVRNNFCGFNWGRGMNPKHTRNVVLVHNTLYDNDDWGLDIHGRSGAKWCNDSPVVKNNLLSLNRSAWWLYDPEIFNEQVDYNFYQNRPGSMLAAFNSGQGAQCADLAEIRAKTRGTSTVNGPYELHGREGDPLLVDPAGGDFRLRPPSPARQAADDGQQCGASADRLVEVGAHRQFSLAHVPDIGQLKLSLVAASSETAAGRAAYAIDAATPTFWEIDTAADARREIELALPGNRPHRLTFLVLTKPNASDQYSYRRFQLRVSDGGRSWRPVPEPPEHPFEGYRGLNNGEVWALPPETTARKLKLTFAAGYGSTIRIPEIRVYGSPVEAERGAPPTHQTRHSP